MAAIELTENAYRVAEELAKQQARPIGDVVSELLLDSVKGPNSVSNSPPVEEMPFLLYEGPMRVPVFRASADAPVLTTEMVKKMMEEFP